MRHVAVIIPSFCPPEGLSVLCEELKRQDFQKILVINDGSPKDYDSIFEALNVDLIQSDKNRGKGHAIKLGISYALKSYTDVSHFIFCDDDGQHAVRDVARVAREAVNERRMFILGQRNFPSHTPWKSLLGNVITSLILRFRYGLNAPDSQTGLRCVARELASQMLTITEERFGFELKTLIMLHQSSVEIYSVPIETIYYEGNSRTRFRPIRDSLSVLTIALGFKR